MLKIIATCHSLLITHEVWNESSLPARFLSLPFQFVPWSYTSTSKCKSKPLTERLRSEGETYRNSKAFKSSVQPVHSLRYPYLILYIVQCDAIWEHVVDGAVTSRPPWVSLSHIPHGRVLRTTRQPTHWDMYRPVAVNGDDKYLEVYCETFSDI